MSVGSSGVEIALESITVSSANVVLRRGLYGYSAYGETQALGVDGDIPNNANQYTARENDGLVGGTGGGSLYYYRARYYDPVLKRFVAEDPVGLAASPNLYQYVRDNPLRWSDPYGLDIYTIHVGIGIPFVGGFDGGFLYNTGSGEINGFPDIGVFTTIKKNYSGLGRFKTTWGISQTLGSRCNFDGTDAELQVGLGAVGGSIGGFDKNNKPTTLSFDFGPQLGFGADLTQTFSFTVGDIGRLIARLIHGPGGGNWCGCQR